MEILIWGLLIYWIVKKVKSDQRASDIGKVIGIVFGIIFLIGLLGPILAGAFPLLIIVGVLLYLKRKDLQKYNERRSKYGWDDLDLKDLHKKDSHQKESEFDREYDHEKSFASKVLPKPIGKRKKIIESFSEKFGLNLTQEQVKCIADASYMSLSWKMEVENMTNKYDALHQWFTGNTAYLRAYLYVFPVQDVSSDFKQQFQICVSSFQEIFNYSDTLEDQSISEKIQSINSKFLTNFDDVTYMIAYRFLEKLGFYHELGNTTVHSVDAELDALRKKYEQM